MFVFCFFFEGNCNFMHFETHIAVQNAENLKKIRKPENNSRVSPVKLGRVTLNTGIFIWPRHWPR